MLDKIVVLVKDVATLVRGNRELIKAMNRSLLLNIIRQERTGEARVIPTFKHFVDMRERLMPYIWREAQYSAQSGRPMMRAADRMTPFIVG